MEERMLSVAETARRLGVSVRTLARWRTAGKGPAGYLYVSPTWVVYPAEAVTAFLDARRASPPRHQRPPRRVAAPREAIDAPADAFSRLFARRFGQRQGQIARLRRRHDGLSDRVLGGLVE